MRPLIAFTIGLGLTFAGCGGSLRSHPDAIEVAPCHIGGCSGEICSDREDLTSICTWQPEFVCYRSATCAPQADGVCGWTQTPELTACLERPGPR